MTNATASPPPFDCPTWCDYGTPDHNGDHWRSGSYVAATRSTPTYADQGGAMIPAIGVHLARFQHGDTDVVLHVGASGQDDGRDEEIRLSLSDAIEHAAQLITAISVGLDGRSSGGGDTETFRLIEEGVSAIVAAHVRRPSLSGANA